MLDRIFSLVRVNRKLIMGKNSTMVVTSSTGTETSIDMTELAALNSINATELGFLDGVTAGTAAASKAVVLDSNKDVSALRNLTVTNLDAGASGTAGTLDVFPTTAAKGKLIISCDDQDGATNVTLKPAPMAQASVISIPDPGAATANVLLTSAANDQAVVTATSVELNYNDITTLGTLAASKTWSSDASLDTIMPTGGLLTVQSGGAVTMNTGSTLTNDATVVHTAVATEHGAGAIGTSSFGAPQVRRWTEGGVIITQHKFDLTGLASVATVNDVIGLAAGGTANIGRNVEATNGVIFKTEFSCIETPLTGDNDVNVVANSSSSLAYDGAGGTTYAGGNAGDLLKGQTISFLTPALTEGDYYYLTAGTGDTAGTYTAGMYIFTTYGHAAL